MGFEALVSAVVIVATLGAPLARAADTVVSPADAAALTAPVQKVADALNKADPLWPKDVFTTDATAIDDFAPFRWSGKTTAREWYMTLVGTTPKTHAAFVAMKLAVKLDSPAFPQISGTRAYVVFPTTIAYMEAGKRVQQSGQWVIVEQKIHGAWYICAHAWATTGQGPATN